MAKRKSSGEFNEPRKFKRKNHADLPAEAVEDKSNKHVEKNHLNMPCHQNAFGCDFDTDLSSINTLKDLEALIDHDARNSKDTNTFSGVKLFFLFLDITNRTWTSQNPTKELISHKSIVEDFLKLQLTKLEQHCEVTGTTSKILLENLFKIWHFSSQCDNELGYLYIINTLLVLIQLSEKCEGCRDFGGKLGEAILSETNVTLLSRGLLAQSHKYFILNKSWELLSTLCQFENGRLIRLIYYFREKFFTDRTLVKILKIGMGKRGKKCTIPTNLLENYPGNYILQVLQSFIKFGDDAQRVGILKHFIAFKLLFQNGTLIKSDLLCSFLDCLIHDILQNGAIPVKVKSRIFINTNLLNLLTLSRAIESKETMSNAEESLNKKIFYFIKFVCTSSESGLIPKSVAHPSLFERNTSVPNDRYHGFDALHGSATPDINTTATGYVRQLKNIMPFVNSLHPHQSISECDLLLELFAIPHLPAIYLRNFTVSLEPNLTFHWIGYFSMFSRIIQLPVYGLSDQVLKPQFSYRPSLLDVVESILPLPITAKLLIRCFNSNVSLINFYTVRLLTLSFIKFSRVMKILNTSPANVYFDFLRRNLPHEFAKRCPPIKPLQSLFHRLSNDQLIMRELVSRLLSLYHLETPNLALQYPFDVSLALSKKLLLVDQSKNHDPLHLLELEHLIHISRCSLSFQWWNLSSQLELSPFTTFLRLAARSYEASIPISSIISIKSALSDVCRDYGILSSTGQPEKLHSSSFREGLCDSLDVLIASLHRCNNSFVCYAFLDKCVNRLFRRSIRYADLACSYIKEGNGKYGRNNSTTTPQISLLVAVLVEQWPFIQVEFPPVDCRCLAGWLRDFILGLCLIGEDVSGLCTAFRYLRRSTASSISTIFPRRSKVVEEARKFEPKLIEVLNLYALTNPDSEEKLESQADYSNVKKCDYLEDLLLQLLPIGSRASFPELSRWSHVSPRSALLDGHITNLLQLLCNQHRNIRLSAFDSLVRFGQAMRSSSTTESQNFKSWPRVKKLLGQTLNTAQPVIDREPLLHTFVAFSTESLSIVIHSHHPLHSLIASILRSAAQDNSNVWSGKRILQSVMSPIFKSYAEDSSCSLESLKWVLNFLVKACQSESDVRLFISQHRIIDTLFIKLTREIFSSSDKTTLVNHLFFALLHSLLKHDFARDYLAQNHALVQWLDSLATLTASFSPHTSEHFVRLFDLTKQTRESSITSAQKS